MKKPGLTPVQCATVRLIGRSTPDADGWYQVSAVLWGFVNHHLPPFLAEKEETSNGGRIRLTPDGEVILWAMR